MPSRSSSHDTSEGGWEQSAAAAQGEGKEAAPSRLELLRRQPSTTLPLLHPLSSPCTLESLLLFPAALCFSSAPPSVPFHPPPLKAWRPAPLPLPLALLLPLLSPHLPLFHPSWHCNPSPSVPHRLFWCLVRRSRGLLAESVDARTPSSRSSRLQASRCCEMHESRARRLARPSSAARPTPLETARCQSPLSPLAFSSAALTLVPAHEIARSRPHTCLRTGSSRALGGELAACAKLPGVRARASSSARAFLAQLQGSSCSPLCMTRFASLSCSSSARGRRR